MLSKMNFCSAAVSSPNTGNAAIIVSATVTTGTIDSSDVKVRLEAICMQRSSSNRRSTMRPRFTMLTRGCATKPPLVRTL